MPGKLQPLVSNQPLVNADGTPTPYFIRWAQQRQIDIGAGISADQAQQIVNDWAAGRRIEAGMGLSGGGSLSADVMLELDAPIGLLNDVDFSTPPTDGQVIVFDEASRKWKPADQSGGGGGGGGGYTPIYSAAIDSPLTGDNTDVPGLALNFTLSSRTDFIIDFGLLFFRPGNSTRVLLYDNGQPIAPHEFVNVPMYYDTANEASRHQLVGGYKVSLATGDHHLTLRRQDAGGNNDIQWYDRWMRGTVVKATLEAGGGGSGGGIPDAPSDGVLYGRKNAAWAEVPSGGGGGPALTPGTYGSATRSTKVIVNDDGEISSVTDVPISGGGGGGGGSPIIGMYQIPGANIPGSTSDTPYPGLNFTFTPPAEGLFKIEWFFMYFGSHRIRFAPRIDGNRLAGINADAWFSGQADEIGAYKGFASIIMPLTAAQHTADLVYNVMDNTDGMSASFSYITVTPIASAF